MCCSDAQRLSAKRTQDLVAPSPKSLLYRYGKTCPQNRVALRRRVSRKHLHLFLRRSHTAATQACLMLSQGADCRMVCLKAQYSPQGPYFRGVETSSHSRQSTPPCRNNGGISVNLCGHTSIVVVRGRYNEPFTAQKIPELEFFGSEFMACHLAIAGVSLVYPALLQGVTLVRPLAKGLIPRTPRR